MTISKTEEQGRTYVLRETRRVQRPIEEVFAYAADFSNSAEWDPGVETADQVGSGEPGVGTRYELMGHFGPSKFPMTYEVTEWNPPGRVVLEGEGDAFAAHDTMEFEDLGDGSTEITYVARITITGPAKYLGPLLNIPMRRMGRRAVDGLADKLSR